MSRSRIDYIIELESIHKDLNQMIAELEGIATLETEKKHLVSAKEEVRAALNSFQRLKGIK
jgi:cell fate (sporulation/competence/biofilm development) regulator YlbF (YheA/YmcA/DUF963 family)